MKALDRARKSLADARRHFLEDMAWLRREFGILAEPEPCSVRMALTAALDALERQDADSLNKAANQFAGLHDQVMRYVLWDMLERTKRGIRSLKQSDPAAYRRKRAQWNAACWEKHPWRMRGDVKGLRNAVKMLSRI